MSSKKKRSHRLSHPQTTPPIVATSVPLTAFSMPPPNSIPPNVHPSHLFNTWMSSRLDPFLDPSLARPDVPNIRETSTEYTHPGAVNNGVGQIVSAHPSFHVNAHVPSAHGSDQGMVSPSNQILTSDERNTRHGFPHRQGNGKSKT